MDDPQTRASSLVEKASRLQREDRGFESHLVHMFTETDGKRRKAIWSSCVSCNKKFSARIYKDRVAKFCSKLCSTENRKRQVNLRCDYCGREFQRTRNKLGCSRSGKVFCCRKHKDLAQRIESGILEVQPPHYGNGSGESSYREKALSHYGKRCKGCSYCELEGMLDVHHIDGERSNNHIDNLMVLCTWCHALITRGFVKITSNRQLIKSQRKKKTAKSFGN